MRIRDKKDALILVAHLRSENREMTDRLSAVENRIKAQETHIDKLEKIIKESK